MNRAHLFAAILSLAAAGHAFAGDCVVSYKRTACPGKEAESYAKCEGKQSCDKKVDAPDVAACQAAALKACANDRLDITASKEITASFDGKPVKSASGKADFCADYAKRDAEFNHCAK